MESPERRLPRDSRDTVFGERVHHREARRRWWTERRTWLWSATTSRFDIQRIFPGRFELVCEGWDPALDGGPTPGMRVTEHALAPARRPGEWGGAFLSFMCLRAAAAIYDRHGLRPVAV